MKGREFIAALGGAAGGDRRLGKLELTQARLLFSQKDQ